MPPFTSVNAAQWQTVAVLSESISAVAMKELLEREGVPVKLRSDTVLLGEARRCEVLVPSDLVHRARAVLSRQEQFTEEELEFLATGRLGCADSRE